MRIATENGTMQGWANLAPSETQVLDPEEERRILQELAQCKSKLARAAAKISGVELPHGADDPLAMSRYISDTYAKAELDGARMGVIYHRYSELRSKLAMANVRLVAHMANRFRDWGVPFSDLLQEGFCGLLEAIDRFDLVHGTKLSTYATWWIRQAMQRAVAAGSYPVRLSPRHLRQLAQNQSEIGRSLGASRDDSRGEHSAANELLQRIHTATQPTLSLDAALNSESGFNLLQTISDPEGDRSDEVETRETVDRLMQELLPRERTVLSLRFGLGGGHRLSLSEVGKVLDVSKERVRQIQERALRKLRSASASDEPAAACS